MEIKVHIEHDPRFRGTAIYLYGKDNEGEFVIEPMNLIQRHYKLGEALNQPTLVMDGLRGEEFLQSLCSELVRLGFKPDELKASNQQIDAIKYHLEDMRRIVFEPINPTE